MGWAIFRMYSRGPCIYGLAHSSLLEHLFWVLPISRGGCVVWGCIVIWFWWLVCLVASCVVVSCSAECGTKVVVGGVFVVIGFRVIFFCLVCEEVLLTVR